MVLACINIRIMDINIFKVIPVVPPLVKRTYTFNSIAKSVEYIFIFNHVLTGWWQ